MKTLLAVVFAAVCVILVCCIALPWIETKGKCERLLWFSVTCSYNIHPKTIPRSDKGVTPDFGQQLKWWSSQVTNKLCSSLPNSLFYITSLKVSCMLVKTIHWSTLWHTSLFSSKSKEAFQEVSFPFRHLWSCHEASKEEIINLSRICPQISTSLRSKAITNQFITL